ncbi:hypothetical protein AB3S75_015634 [Citrus x aurantiifolia]
MAVDKDKPQDEASMLRFCKITLSWDYFHLVKECCFPRFMVILHCQVGPATLVPLGTGYNYLTFKRVL